MHDKELIERVTYVPYDDFVRAHHLMAPPEQAEAAIDEVVARFRQRPDDDFVMGPNFLSFLALFSERGRAIAEAHMTRDEIVRCQRELARKPPAIAREFPDVLAGDV